MSSIYWTAALILVGIVTMRFRDRILGALRRFDQQNVERIARQQQDLKDPNAHFRHAMEMAAEQVEAVEEIKIPDARTGIPVTHYLFEAEVFATSEEAEQMRAARVAVVARRFYQDLPGALAARSGPRSKLSAREARVTAVEKDDSLALFDQSHLSWVISKWSISNSAKGTDGKPRIRVTTPPSISV